MTYTKKKRNTSVFNRIFILQIHTKRKKERR